MKPYEGRVRPGDLMAVTTPSEGQSRDYVIRILSFYPAWGEKDFYLRPKGGGWIYEHVRFKGASETTLNEIDVMPDNTLRRIYTPIKQEEL